MNDPNDPGGETRWGISKRSYPYVDIKGLTRESAIRIYRRDYWDAARCESLPGLVRLCHFDAAVNHGVGAAAKLLQEAVDVTIDGDIGPVTLRAIAAADAQQLLEDYLWLRARLYARLGRDRPASLKFVPGWLLRLIRVRHDSRGGAE